MQLTYFHPSGSHSARQANAPDSDRLAAIAALTRVNALTAIKRAGSGHIGSSFSSADLFTFLYERHLREGDLFFSSKGHDAPGQYAAMAAAGVMPIRDVLNLRRLDGLPGHPEVGFPGVVASTGSLGMGLSKARGMALAHRLKGGGGRIVVLLGDGELQEGQNYEAFRSIVNDGLPRIQVIVDANKIQSDKYVRCINDLGDIEAKIRAFGWDVRRCDGHDFAAMAEALAAFDATPETPHLLIADTVKGKGVSFMEAAPDDGDPSMVYRWHSGAPSDEAYERATVELLEAVSARFAELSLDPPSPSVADPAPAGGWSFVQPSTAQAMGEELVELGREHQELVVLDADLSDDCGLRPFEAAFPDRFFESGIAEQDMVSTAGALAGQGYLPLVASFASFLCARANEQIYNNACEGRRVIHLAQFSGILPAVAGYSHSSIRDIALTGHLPDALVVQPASAAQARSVIRWAVTEADCSVFIRSLIIPPPMVIDTPEFTGARIGVGSTLADGGDIALLAYSPVMLSQALQARDRLREHGVSARILATPWLNRVDEAWLSSAILPGKPLVVVEDHAPIGGLGDRVAATLGRMGAKVAHGGLHVFGVEGLPACGQPEEVLAHHGLDGASLCRRAQELL